MHRRGPRCRGLWQRQLKLVQDEIGFREIRFHWRSSNLASCRPRSPAEINNVLVERQRDAASGKAELDSVVKVGTNGLFTKTLSLCENEFILVKLDRQQ